MIKSELINELAKQTNLNRKDAKIVVETIFNEIKDTLISGGRVELRNFGVLYLHTRKSRMGRNPKTGAQVLIQEKKVPLFKAGKSVLNALNKK